jgi:adenylate cyclase
MATYAVYSGESLADLEKKWAAVPIYINFKVPKARIRHPAWNNKDAGEVSVYRHISVRDIIEGTISPEEKKAINGGIVLVGSTALGSFDHFPSPFMPLFPGVELHANVIDNIMHNDTLKPVNFFIVLPMLILLIWMPVYMSKSSIRLLSLSTVGVITGLLVFNYYVFYKHYELPFLSVVMALAVSFIYVTVYKAVLEGREKKWIKNTFGQYLSPKVVELITKDPSKLSLGGEKRDMTVFFLDIAGFTTMSEKMTPEQLTKMLNNYLSGLTDVILRHDGVVDKYIGDCVMAFWNAPLDQKDHRRLACLAAVDCMGEIDRLNEELTEFSIKPSARIGLNSGHMVVGNMGSKMRLSYTVMGDAVNLASRLEGANKYFHSKIMVSEATYEEARNFIEARMLGQIRVVGKAIPVKVYEPLAHKGKLSASSAKMREAYNEGFEAFYKGAYASAGKSFEAALKAAPADGPSQFYLDLAVKYAAGTPKDWDGTFNLTSK